MKVTVGSQRMYFMGKELENDFNLHDYSVKVWNQKGINTIQSSVFDLQITKPFTFGTRYKSMLIMTANSENKSLFFSTSLINC